MQKRRTWERVANVKKFPLRFQHQMTSPTTSFLCTVLEICVILYKRHGIKRPLHATNENNVEGSGHGHLKDTLPALCCGNGGRQRE